MLYTIRLQQMEFRAYHGCYDLEQKVGNRFQVELTITTPLGAVADEDAVEKAVQIIPAMRSPTVMPLAQEGWCSMHSVVEEKDLWEKIKALKAIGAEGILVLSLDKIIL